MTTHSTAVHCPPIPTQNLTFTDKGLLTFKVLESCSYDAKNNAFVGGDFKPVQFRTSEGHPAWIRLDGGMLVIEELTNYLIDKTNGYFVGGEVKVLLKLACQC